MADEVSNTEPMLARAAAGDGAVWGELLTAHQQRLTRMVAFHIAAMERETWFSADEFRRLGLATVIPSKGPGESVATNRAIANRSVRNQSIVDRLINERTTPRKPSVSAAEVMRFAARVRDDQFQYERQLNRETIIRNARSPERAQRYLRWS